MRFIHLAVAACGFMLFGSAYAEDHPGKTGLSDSMIEEIVGKNVPDEISVKLTEESEDAVALKTCQKTLTGLKVPKNCCKDPKCVRAAIKQRDNEAFEKRRAEVNRKFCLEYGGGLDTCNNPDSARLFVISHRAKLKAEEEKKSDQARLDAEKARSSAEEAIRIANEAKRSASEVKSQPPVIIRLQQDDNRPKHHLDLGLALVGHLEGAYGGGVSVAYRPPIVDERLQLNVVVGALVVVKNRLKIDNFDPVVRAYGDANLSFRVLNWDNLNLALGCSYARIGRFGMDRLTAEMVGPTATLNIGVLQLHGAYLYNTGPVNGYLTPGWGVLLRAGFRFADFKF
jgi:hypothetical protein